MKYDDYKTESPYSNEVESNSCLECGDYFPLNELTDNICSDECEESFKVSLEYAIGGQFEVIEWEQEPFLGIAQALYDKAYDLGLSIADNIVLDAKEKNVIIKTK